ncbi:MAG: hypothetical protein OSB73_23740 [Candidatus Latescibacteria bacterium]|nr:hypothetical protein [Candidatus Latescibacterota bacterium]
MGFTGREISHVLATRSVAAPCSPLLASWLADRCWPAEVFAGYRLSVVRAIIVVGSAGRCVLAGG